MSNKLKYAIIGLGYIAERHLRAIKETGGEVVLAYDRHETGGVLDKYFIHAEFCDSERDFWLSLKDMQVDYVVICTPNEYHFEHIQKAVERGVKVICEKPLSVSYSDALSIAGRTDVYTILQLRLHPVSQLIRQRIDGLMDSSELLHIDVTYHTPRGTWYHYTWKSKDENGGILLNIGVHIFDLLTDMLGMPELSMAKHSDYDAFVFMEYPYADVKVRMNISKDVLPQRTIAVNGVQFDLTAGFEDLHTESYRQILAGNGFTVADALASLQLIDMMKKT